MLLICFAIYILATCFANTILAHTAKSEWCITVLLCYCRRSIWSSCDQTRFAISPPAGAANGPSTFDVASCLVLHRRVHFRIRRRITKRVSRCPDIGGLTRVPPGGGGNSNMTQAGRKEVKISDLAPQQLSGLKEQLEGELEGLQQSAMTLQNVATEFHNSGEAIEALNNQKEGTRSRFVVRSFEKVLESLRPAASAVPRQTCQISAWGSHPTAGPRLTPLPHAPCIGNLAPALMPLSHRISLTIGLHDAGSDCSHRSGLHPAQARRCCCRCRSHCTWRGSWQTQTTCSWTLAPATM